MKNFILLLLFSLVVSCTTSDSPASQVGQEVAPIKIDLADKACLTDADCAEVATQCSCSCGEGVSKDKLKKYEDLVGESCKNFQGPYCKVLCNGQVKCLEKICTYVNS